jgi:hypothetical protein
MLQFVNLYTIAFMFLRNVLLENYSPFEQHNDYLLLMYRWTAKLTIVVTAHIKEESYFPKSVIVLVSLA